uniref:Uncharacterized protein n=1 Tax=Oryza glumipatula TaxID=40148 RepID=A0A0E0BTA1_9ORYZ
MFSYRKTRYTGSLNYIKPVTGAGGAVPGVGELCLPGVAAADEAEWRGVVVSGIEVASLLERWRPSPRRRAAAARSAKGTASRRGVMREASSGLAAVKRCTARSETNPAVASKALLSIDLSIHGGEHGGESLWCALAETLRAFRPLAGELTYSPSSATPRRRRTTLAETDVEFEDLAGAKKLDADVFAQLAPDIRKDEPPTLVLAVQVTELACGGVAVGLALHHAAADGNGRIRFMQAWSAAVADAVENPEAVLHNWSLIHIDDAEE